MILESLVTTCNEDASVNIAPMGPLVDRAFTSLTLRPFQTSRTFANLQRQGEGVVHVVDDVELLAWCAVGEPLRLPPLQPASRVKGQVIETACRWYEFRVLECDTRSARATLTCEIVHRGRQRDLWGFNRAQYAVVEASILATRVSLLPAEDVARQFTALATIVEKTGGDQERRAFAFLEQYVQRATSEIDRQPSAARPTASGDTCDGR